MFKQHLYRAGLTLPTNPNRALVFCTLVTGFQASLPNRTNKMFLFSSSAVISQFLPETPSAFRPNQTPKPHKRPVRSPKSMGMAERSNCKTTNSKAQRRSMSAVEARISLLFALASQASSQSQRLCSDLALETTKYVFPKRFDARNLEEALMAVPDLETVKFKVLERTDEYEIREVEPYYIVETIMRGKTGFDFTGSSQSFNVLAEYLFGKNTKRETMEMTTPVFTWKGQSEGDRMEMTTPFITKKVEDQDSWQMAFVMPSKYGSDLPLPKDPTVRIREVPRKIVAIAAFSGFVTDEEVKMREYKLRKDLQKDVRFQVKKYAVVEVAQYNPPFTLPFARRNEIALEVEKKQN